MLKGVPDNDDYGQSDLFEKANGKSRILDILIRVSPYFTAQISDGFDSRI